MLFTRSILICASLVAQTIAQTTSRIAFTSLPQSMTAGQQITLSWGGGDGSPVTITLQQGTTSNLQTVQLITGSASGTSYTFTVPASLPNADDYAFRIQQGDSQPNYTGMITLTGGSGTGSAVSNSASASAFSSTAPAFASASASSSASSGGVVPAPVPVGGSGSSGSSNATAAGNATTTAHAGTAPAASGTGASVSRNTTMSMATLSSTSSSSSSSASETSTSHSSSTGTGSSPAPSKTGAATMLASNFALLVCAVVGIVYFG